MSETDTFTGYVDMVEDAMRANPLAASLVGMGVAWLFTGGAASGFLAGVTGQAQKNSALETASGMMSAAHDATGRAGDLLSGAREKLSGLLTDQPLLLAIGGLALGAAIAASLPATDMERDAFGEASNAAKTQAGAFIEAQTENAKRALHDAAAAAQEEAKRQGLTAQALGADALNLVAHARDSMTGARA